MINIKEVAEIIADLEELNISVFDSRGLKLWEKNYLNKNSLWSALSKINSAFQDELFRRVDEDKV